MEESVYFSKEKTGDTWQYERFKRNSTVCQIQVVNYWFNCQKVWQYLILIIAYCRIQIDFANFLVEFQCNSKKKKPFGVWLNRKANITIPSWWLKFD
jgi:hypothetical protein